MAGSRVSEILKRDGLYPLRGIPSLAVRSDPRNAPWTHVVRAQPTGEKRPPKKGEWYLSGAIIEAWQAPNDLATPFHIARLVRTKRTIDVVEVIE